MDGASEKSVVVKFYLVRHGETKGNVEGIVVGQDESPLTERGGKQAEALGLHCEELMQLSKIDKIFVSDQPRAQNTARILLCAMSANQSGTFRFSYLPEKDEKNESALPEDVHHLDSNSSKSITIFIDPRLREVAKGAREGFPKSTTYEEALSKRNVAGENIPELESYDQVWERLYHWMYSVVWDAIFLPNEKRKKLKNSGYYDVLAVSHAGSLRLLLQKLVSESHPLLQSSIPEHSSQPRSDSQRFPIPNTSLTILQLTVRDAQNLNFWPKYKPKKPPVEDPLLLWLASPVELTWTRHFDHVHI